VNDPDETMIFPLTLGDDVPERSASYEDFTADEERPEANPVTGLVSLGFITAALKRKAWVWCVTAVVGLVLGCGLYVKFPAPYQASTSLLLTNVPTEGPADAMATNVALAQSPTVAGRVIADLRLPLTVTGFLATYTVLGVTDEVLTITVSAPSSTAAVARASALATEFLRFRTSTLLAQQQLSIKAQEQQISQTQQSLNSIDSQIRSVQQKISTQPDSATLQGTLRSLRAQGNRISGVLTALQSTESTNQASIQSSTATVIAGSEVINPAIPLHHSRLKYALEYVAGGLVLGLALGMGIIAVRALASSRLRSRDDIAEALGSSVKLSVGAVRAGRRLRPGLAPSSSPNMRHIVGFLLRSIPRSLRGPAGLAVVAVDNEQVAAATVVSLAITYASRDKKVVLADLSGGYRAARLLGVKKPGVHATTKKGVNLIVAVPDRDDIAPAGPLRSSKMPGPASEAVMDACTSADLVLSLVTLDPAFGGDHLATWATDAVVMVTAGHSSAVRVRAVGEMVRLAGTRLSSAIVLEADRGDEGLGVAYAEEHTSVASPN
jgi:capsular polysaccharide biosynthesis protein